MKIYDCFTFFNELDILELRLLTLWDVVDYFVICEATVNFRGKEKPLNFLANEARFEKYKNKIRYLVADDLSEKSNESNDEYTKNWIRENHQRNWLAKGYTDAVEGDLILVSDLDEIPRPDIIINLSQTAQKDKYYVLLMNYYAYYLNNQLLLPSFKISPLKRFYYKTIKGKSMQPDSNIFQWKGTVAARYNPDVVPQDHRNKAIDKFLRNGYFIENAGWHLSYMADLDNIKLKINSFAHSEFVHAAHDDFIKSRILAGKSIFDDSSKFELLPTLDTLPTAISKNLRTFQHLLMNTVNNG